MEEPEINLNTNMVKMANHPRTLQDYAILSSRDTISSIIKPLVHVNNLEIKLSIIHTIQHNQFGAVAEDPYTHFAKFIQIVTPLN